MIDPVGLKQALAQVRDDFVTKDVSEQSVLRGAHGGLAAHSHWHAFVGKALRLHAVGLGIEFLDTGASRGARWQKLLATTERVHRPAAAIPTAPARPTTLANAGGTALNARRELGPQYAGDSAFTARKRFHQSHCRATVLRGPFGHGPNAGDVSRYGNMLDPISAHAGLNYLSPLIFAKVRERLAAGGGVLEPYRLLHNMLSSQPMCFNLFGPLMDAPSARPDCSARWSARNSRESPTSRSSGRRRPRTSTSTTARPSTRSSSTSVMRTTACCCSEGQPPLAPIPYETGLTALSSCRLHPTPRR